MRIGWGFPGGVHDTSHRQAYSRIAEISKRARERMAVWEAERPYGVVAEEGATNGW